MKIKFINIEDIPYKERAKQYIIISQDCGYDQNGKYYKSDCSKLKYIDRENNKNSESIFYSFHSTIKRMAIKEAEKRGLNFIYVSYA